MPSAWVYIDGQILPADKAMVPVIDRQFLYGDGIYETIRLYNGQPFLFQSHMFRLRQSGSSIFLTIPWSDNEIFDQIIALSKASSYKDCVVRVIVTRGDSDYGLEISKEALPRLIILLRPIPLISSDMYKKGVFVVVPEIRRVSLDAVASHVKSANYLNQVMALEEGRKKGAYEVIMLDSFGNLAEGSTSNIFFIKDDILFTPALESSILPGITRAIVLYLAEKSGICVKEGLYKLDVLLSSDEIFLTATVKEIVPVFGCMDKFFVNVPGDITKQLMCSYQEVVLSCIESKHFDDMLCDSLKKYISVK